MTGESVDADEGTRDFVDWPELVGAAVCVSCFGVAIGVCGSGVESPPCAVIALDSLDFTDSIEVGSIYLSEVVDGSPDLCLAPASRSVISPHS